MWAAVMTAALVTSSFTMTLAARAARDGRDPTGWLGATLALGGAFLAIQGLEYHHLLTGPRVMGLSTDTFSGTFYAITGYHGLHVLAGLALVAWLFVAGRSRARAVEVVAIFWHFVDLAWIPIFSLLYLLPVT
jgi:heme/copper-type cytochrome/quinol oxidase subunit 3